MNSKNFLAITLLFNVALAAVAAFVYKSKPPTTETVVGTTIVESTNTRVVSRKGAARVVVTNAPGDQFSWRQVESAEYKAYIKNLRAIECPEETIRDIILADVNKLYAEKFKALRGPDKEYKYWEVNRGWGSKDDFEKQKKYRALEKEKKELLKDLLGVDPQKEMQEMSGGFDYWDRMYGFLPADKKDKAREIQDKYQELEQEIYQRAQGNTGEEDQKELRKLNKQKLEEMAQFLTPEQLEEYNLRTSNLASQMRWDLDGFEPTEKEFREIFKIRNAYADDLEGGGYDPDDKAANERRAKTEAKVNQETKDLLGDERYAEYQRGKDWEYKKLARLADRQGLPKESALKVYDMKKVVEEQAQKIRRDQTLTQEQRNEALKAMKTETERSITETLGEKGYKSYKRDGGWWIQNLSR